MPFVSKGRGPWGSSDVMPASCRMPGMHTDTPDVFKGTIYKAH